MIERPTAEARLARVVDAVSASARRPLDIDGAVFDSERSTGLRNRAIGHLLRNDDILRDDPDGALGLHFRQCALLVDRHDLALVAATLANGGVKLVTRSRAVAAGFVGPILGVMTTCGVHDFTGEWVYRVGLPAHALNYQPRLVQGLDWGERVLLKLHGIDPSTGVELSLAQLRARHDAAARRSGRPAVRAAVG